MRKLELDPNSWAQLNALLDTALNLPITAREKWLSELESQHEALKPRLRDLLARAPQIETSDFMQTLPKIPAERLPDSRFQTRNSGDVAGSYRLLRELGSGGMGSVWLAERTDHRMASRQVALKLPHLRTQRAGLAERMEREREILASLNHPNIATLYDAGVTEEGQPYLALEYVAGLPIDVYCAEAKLDLPARLKLFVQVASAVAHAHTKLVIHRDLKPSNILVAKDGQARLLDFGVAKLLGEEAASKSKLTELSGLAMTLGYASPEQVLGASLTTASDVYSLGVILYELLTGRRPYRLQRDSRGALEDAILQVDAKPPSELASRLESKALRGDLDTIVLKALKKKPEERYATVTALVDDVVRYLENRPVLAQPDSRWYVFVKFVKRNRLMVGAGIAVVVAIVAGASIAVFQGRVALQEKNRAEEVKQFIASIFVDADPLRGSGESLSAVSLLRLAQARLASTTTEPGLRLELLNILAESMLHLDDVESASQVIDEALSAASAGGDESSSAVRARLLHARIAAARDHSAQALQEVESVIAEAQAPSFDREIVASALVAKAQIEFAMSKYELAEQDGRIALATVQQSLGESIHGVDALLVVSRANNYLRRNDASFAAAQEAYELANKVYEGNESHPAMNAVRFQYAITLIDQDRVDEALTLMRANIPQLERLFGPDSRVVGNYYASMSQYLVNGGDPRGAIRASEHAMRILAPKITNHNSVPYASLLDNRALALLAARRAAEALPFTVEARDFVQRELGMTHESSFVLTVQLGRELALLGRIGEARQHLAWVIAEYRKAGRSTLGTPLYAIGLAERLGGNAVLAADYQQQALKHVQPGPRARRLSARIFVELGLAQLAKGDLADSERNLREGKAIFEEKFRSRPPEYADALVGLGRAALQRNAPSDALPFLSTADEFWRDFDGQNRFAGEAALWLGRCYLAIGDRAKAKSALMRAEEILKRSPLPSDKELVKLAMQR